MNSELVNAPAQTNASNPAQAGLDPQLIEHIKSQMADIIEPAAIGWWPLAWGWWVLIAAACSAVSLVVLMGIKHYLANRYRRNAIKILQNNAQQNQNAQQQAQNLMQLSKQIALHAYPNHRHIIAKAHGQDWLNWLNSTTKTPLFNTAQAQQWQQALYSSQGQDQNASPALNALLQQWVKKHFNAKTYSHHNRATVPHSPASIKNSISTSNSNTIKGSPNV